MTGDAPDRTHEPAEPINPDRPGTAVTSENTADVIERAARAARTAYGNWFGEWDDDAACPEYKRNDWRNVARAVLAASQPAPEVPAGADVAAVLAGLVEMHFDTDGVIHRSSFEHVRREALWEHARQVVETLAATGARAADSACDRIAALEAECDRYERGGNWDMRIAKIRYLLASGGTDGGQS